MRKKISNIKYQISNIIGFTVIEILIVVGIIGFLASTLFVSFSTSQKQARDTQRKSDLKQYSALLEAYYNSNGNSYPLYTVAINLTTLCSTLNTLNCLNDPKGGTYYYQSNAAATSFVIWATLESAPSTTYYVFCSSGINGRSSSGVPPVGGTCPTDLFSVIESGFRVAYSQ